MPDVAAVILAAGQGTRMRSAIPKVLHRIAGRPMIDYVVKAARSAGIGRVLVVLGRDAEKVQAVLGEGVEVVSQPTPLGTAHALLQARPVLQADRACDEVLVAHGDCPLLTGDLFDELIRQRRQTGARIALVASPTDSPRGYGRIIRDAAGNVRGIVEEANLTDEQRAVQEINAGVYCFDAGWLWENLPAIGPAPNGEYYLTDIVALAVRRGDLVRAIEAPLSVTAGVNDRCQLAEAERLVRSRIRRDLMGSGVTLLDPTAVYVDADATVGPDTVIYPGTIVEGGSRIGRGCRIGPYTRIVDSSIGDGTVVELSVVERSEVAAGVRIGPFSHLRPGARLEEGVELGNYAEVKNARLGAHTKMHHFSYVGDADVGRGVNIGAGTVTTNYDSEMGRKHRTVVEDGASLGSDTLLVAPLTIGKDALTGAGAVVTRDVEPGTVVVGVPARPLRRRRVPPV